MRTGTALLELVIHESQSLKDKRQIVKSLIERGRLKFNASIAEVGMLNSHTHAEVGIAVVSNETKHCHSMLDAIIEHFESDPRADLISVDQSID